MGEPPGAEPVGRADQHPGLGGLTEQGQDGTDRAAGHPGQDGRVQVRAEHGGGRQQPGARLTEGVEPALDRVLGPWGTAVAPGWASSSRATW